MKVVITTIPIKYGSFEGALDMVGLMRWEKEKEKEKGFPVTVIDDFIPRNDPILIKLVEDYLLDVKKKETPEVFTLCDKSTVTEPFLKIIELPDNVPWKPAMYGSSMRFLDGLAKTG